MQPRVPRPLTRATVAVLAVVGLGACSTTPSTSATKASTPSGTVSATRPDATASAPATPTAVSTVAGPVKTATPTRAGDQSPVLAALPGSAKAGCVAVGDRTDVRSGTLAAGNFATARQQFKDQASSVPQPTVNLYIIPADARRLQSVTVTLEQVGGKHVVRKVTSSSVQDAEQWQYFAVQLTVPTAGTWRVRAASGRDVGCFDVRFG